MRQASSPNARVSVGKDERLTWVGWVVLAGFSGHHDTQPTRYHPVSWVGAFVVFQHLQSAILKVQL